MNILFNSCRALGFFVLFSGLIGQVTANDTWSEIKPLNLEQMTGEAYDSAPRIATDNSGNVMALWRSDIRDTNFARLAVAFSPTKGTTYGGESYIDFGDTPGLTADVAYAGNGIWVGVATRNDGDYYKGVFFRSFDNGRTWITPSPLSLAIMDPKISLDSDKAGTLIASAGSAIFRSTDFGETWTETPPIVPRVGDYWTSPVGVIESLVTTNGSGKWIHVYLSYEDYYNNFEYHALVSTDNGLNWENVWDLEAIRSSPALEDVCISGNEIVIAVTIDPLNGFYISRTGGDTWSEFIQFSEDCHNVAIAAQDTRWSVLASPRKSGGPWGFVSNDLES